MPRIYDMILFSDQVDALRKRFTALEEVPGLVHVICEALADFQGNPKPLHFWENREKFSHWRSRWNHVRVEAHELHGTPAQRERTQREYLMHGCHGDPQDIIFFAEDISDIPDAQELEKLARRKILPSEYEKWRQDVPRPSGSSG